MAFLSNSYRSKMRGKSELLYGGRDAVKSSTERTAKRTFETMAFLLVRERANLWCAWVLYHALGPEDVNCLWVHDQLEVIPTDMSGAVKVRLDSRSCLVQLAGASTAWFVWSRQCSCSRAC